jgi:hypothetical protein
MVAGANSCNGHGRLKVGMYDYLLEYNGQNPKVRSMTVRNLPHALPLFGYAASGIKAALRYALCSLHQIPATLTVPIKFSSVGVSLPPLGSIVMA